MSHKLKGRLRLVDPADPDDVSEIDMSDDEEAAASSSGIDGGASTEAARAPPPPSRRRRGSIDDSKTAKKTASPIPARLRPDGAASSQPRRAARSGGLLSRLRNIRKKEVSTTSGAAASPVAASPKRQSMASDRLASGQSSPGSIIPVGRASLAGPRETLGIDAFTKPHRASTANSLMTSELLDNSSPVSRSATPSALVLKDYGVEHQPDLMQPNLKRESTARYSIAHSVEASLIDSWSVAGDDDDEDGISAVSGRSRDDGENDWMRTGMAPMVSDNYTDIDAPSAVTGDDEDDEGDETESEGHGRRTPTKAAAVATAAAVPAAAAVAKPPMARTVTDRSAATTADYYDADDRSTTAGTSASRAAARRSDVDRLLLQLGDTGATGAAIGAGAAAAAAAGSSSIVSSRQSTTLSDAEDYEEEAASSATPSNARSSVAYSTEIDDSESAIVPDDSVSVRAMQRAAQEEEDGAMTPTAAKTTDPDKLALLLADMEPAFDERSEDEGELEEEEDEEEEEEGEEEDEDEELTEAPVAAAAVGRRTPAASTRSTTKAAREARRRRRVKLGKANQGANRWLEDSALTPEQMHYFIKAMVSRELEWEWARAFAFDPSDRPPLPAAATSSSTSKVREYDIFRKSKVDVASLPKFPLLRFLYDSAFCMLPIFGHGTTTYAKRQKRAEAYWSRGVAPLLRILQNRSFSHRVDRCGEGDGSAFSAETTSDVIQGAIHRAAVRFITATINVGGKRDVKEGWPWPSAKLMKLPAFLPYRLPLAQQSRGAFEVDVVVMRPQGKEPSYILRLRRQFGHPSIFVIRSEAQFLEYASALNEALPRACIKRPPPVEMAAAAETGANGKPVASAPSEAGSSTAVGSTRSKPPLRTKPSSDSKKGLTSGGSTVNADAAPPAEKGRLGFAGMFGSRGKSSGAAAAPPVAAMGGKGSAAAGPQASTGVDRSLLELRDNKRRSVLGSRSSLPLSPGSPPADDDGSNVGSIRSSTVGPGKNGSAAGAPSSNASATGGGLLKGKGTPKKTKPPPLPTIDYNLRRLQLRDWLRDTLSARGAGHHAETREFLTAGFFTDKDLKSSTKAKIAANEEADRANTKQREEVALEAGEEVLELRDQIEAMWEECKRGQGFLEARAVFEQASSFSELPEDYQRLVSYLHLKVARFLLGTFVTGDESLGNLRRLRSAFSAIPWKLLRLVLTEPTGVMVADLRRALTAPKFVSGMISILFDDDSRKINEDLDELKRRLPADYLRKIRRFVEATSDHTKRLIRDQARRSGIPLVSAIERGSDEPLLEGKELGRVIQATRGYVAFMETRPSFIDVEVEARINKDVALILDLQQALRLYSARRDGQNLRELARSETFRTAVGHVVQPLLDHLARQHHRKRGSRLKAALKLIEVRGVALLELLEALRTRVQDPAKSIDALTTFLDSHAHDTVQLISHVATPLFTWLHHVARTVNEGSSDLAREWPLPKDGSNGASAKKDSSGLANPLSSDEGLDGVRRLTERAWLGRLRDMELASRWIAGDVEADLSVQVLGSGGGGEKTRTLPILPEEPKRPELDRKIFDGVLPGFREALAKVLESRED